MITEGATIISTAGRLRLSISSFTSSSVGSCTELTLVLLSNVMANSTAMLLLSNLRNKKLKSLRDAACSDMLTIITRDTATSTVAATASRKSSCSAGENSSTLTDSPSVRLMTTDTALALQLNPGSHVVQTKPCVPFADLYLPAEHLHWKTSETPERSWPEFAGQGEQGVLRDPGASTSCQVDGGQGTHADMPAASATLPLAHNVQLLSLEAAMLSENLPGAQESHTEELGKEEKVPAEQAVQV